VQKVGDAVVSKQRRERHRDDGEHEHCAQHLPAAHPHDAGANAKRHGRQLARPKTGCYSPIATAVNGILGDGSSSGTLAVHSKKKCPKRRSSLDCPCGDFAYSTWLWWGGGEFSPGTGTVRGRF